MSARHERFDRLPIAGQWRHGRAAWPVRGPPLERAGVMRRAAEVMQSGRDEIIGWLIREPGSTRIRADLEFESVYAVFLEAASMPCRTQGHILPADVPAEESRLPPGLVSVLVGSTKRSAMLSCCMR